MQFFYFKWLYCWFFQLGLYTLTIKIPVQLLFLFPIVFRFIVRLKIRFVVMCCLKMLEMITRGSTLNGVDRVSMIYTFLLAWFGQLETMTDQIPGWEKLDILIQLRCRNLLKCTHINHENTWKNDLSLSAFSCICSFMSVSWRTSISNPRPRQKLPRRTTELCVQFPVSTYHFDSSDKLWPLMVYHSENPRACYMF